MIINIGNRRLVSHRYGWKIEIKKVRGDDSANPGEEYWDEDRPAWPASLTQALEMVYERLLFDVEETDYKELSRHIVDAHRTLEDALERIREAAA